MLLAESGQLHAVTTDGWVCFWRWWDQPNSDYSWLLLCLIRMLLLGFGRLQPPQLALYFATIHGWGRQRHSLSPWDKFFNLHSSVLIADFWWFHLSYGFMILSYSVICVLWGMKPCSSLYAALSHIDCCFGRFSTLLLLSLRIYGAFAGVLRLIWSFTCCYGILGWMGSYEANCFLPTDGCLSLVLKVVMDLSYRLLCVGILLGGSSAAGYDKWISSWVRTVVQ